MMNLIQTTCMCSLALLLMVATMPSVVCADIYKFVDADGVIHFTNTPTTSNFKLHARENGSKFSIKDMISRCATYYRLEEALVKAVIKVESDYNPSAVSSKGALGMMQLIPTTAELLKVSNPLDPEQNIRGGSHYLRMMLDQFDGNLDLALAAYNAGPTAVRRYGGVPPFKETERYLTKVKYYLNLYRSGGDVI